MAAIPAVTATSASGTAPATYRVIYTIDEDKHLIVIDAVLPRGTAYRPR